MRLKVFFLLTIFLGVSAWMILNQDQEVFRPKAEDREMGYSGPSQFEEFHRSIRTEEGKMYPGYQNGYLKYELEKAKRLQRFSKNNEITYDWIERGPANFPGRTRGLAIDQGDPTLQTWLAGSAGGGVWKTVNGGSSWTRLTEDLPNLATTVVEIAPSNNRVIYVGTGEGFYNFSGIEGDGIFKSTDGGINWTQLSSTGGQNGFKNINSIIIDPLDENTLLTCSNGFPGEISKVHRSTDGGQTWDQVYQSFNRIQQLVHDPTNFMIQFAAINEQGLIKSTDGGVSWSNTADDVYADGRMQIAISPSNPQVMYVAAEGSTTGGTGSDLFYSSDGGNTWEVLKEEGDEQIDWLGEQGWYNNTVAVHPQFEDLVYVGGIDLYKSQLMDDTSTGTDRLKSVQEVGTIAFMDFVNAGLSRLRGGFASSLEWFASNDGFPIDLNPDDFTSVEILFGPGRSQKAHRFEVPDDSGSSGNGGPGVAPADYKYAGLVDVPFEVWDTETNTQLTVSFRDQERDGFFNLIERDINDEVSGREYIFVHAIPYTGNLDVNVATDGGHGFRSIYTMWPTLARDAIWQPESLPASKISVSYGPVRFRNKTTDQLTNGSVVHVDHHNLKFNELTSGNYQMVLATDGGIFASLASSLPGETSSQWLVQGNGMNTGQFYGVDKSRDSDSYIGGMQDNGTNISPINSAATSNTLYSDVIGGDGFDVVWNYANPQLIVGSTQFNQFRKSTDGGNSVSSAVQSLTDVGEDKAPFFSRLANHKARPNVLFTIGVSGVWKSTDFAEEWNLVPMPTNWVTNETIGNNHSVEVSLADPDIIWAGGGMTNSLRVHVSVDGGDSFVSTNNFSTETLGRLTGIATHPDHDSTAFVLYSFADKPKVIRTDDLGETWTDISGFDGVDESSNGFPDVAVYSLLVLPTDNKTIWVGTEIGIFESTDEGESWHLLNGNLPSVAVWKIIPVDDQIVIATHGRGIWTVTMEGLDWPGEFEAIEEPTLASSELNLFPNPVENIFTLTLGSEVASVGRMRIIDSRGTTVLDKEVDVIEGANFYQVEVTTLGKGSYIVYFETGGSAQSIRMVKL